MSTNGSGSGGGGVVDQAILDMATLKTESKKWLKLRKSSKRLRKRYKKTTVTFDPENPFCQDKRELDLQLMVAKNANPRLTEPFHKNKARNKKANSWSFQVRGMNLAASFTRLCVLYFEPSISAQQ